MARPSNVCPDCDAPVAGSEDGASYIVECSACGWAAATTNRNTPAFDPQLYDVFVATEVSAAVAASRVAAVLGRPARALLSVAEGCEPVCSGVSAIEVQRVANLLGKRGILLRIDPEFPWPLRGGDDSV